jgi:hypothetical protein
MRVPEWLRVPRTDLTRQRAVVALAATAAFVVSTVMAPTCAVPAQARSAPATVPAPAAVAAPAAATAWEASTDATPAPVSTATVSPAVPTTAEIGAATTWIRKRRGSVAFATVDSSGTVHGYRQNVQFQTASVVKAMLLVAYLRTHATLKPGPKLKLDRMIRVSDNNAATAVYKVVGDRGLRALAKAAGMRNFSVSVSWGRARLTPADQAHYFYVMDSLVPTQHVGFARYLLSHIIPAHSWAIPAVARPAGWKVFFKGGWIPRTADNNLVHQVARLEKGGVTFSMAVMTDGDPTEAYGIATIKGVAARLLGLSK